MLQIYILFHSQNWLFGILQAARILWNIDLKMSISLDELLNEILIFFSTHKMCIWDF